MTAAPFPAAAVPPKPAVMQRLPQPGVVFVACYLLAGMAALRVVAAVAAFFVVPEFTWIYSEQYGDEERGQAMAFGVAVLGILSLFVAAIYVVLAILDGHGLNWARILTWVVGGITVLSLLLILAIDVYDEVPWYQRLTGFIAWMSLGFVVASLVLLALPPAHRYYKSMKPPSVRPMPAWPPPPPRQPPWWYAAPPAAPPPMQPRPPEPPPWPGHTGRS
jgi:hypothetical protein